MGKLIRISITVLLIIVAVIAGHWVWQHYLYAPWTRDGRVRAQIITIAPDVSGWVKKLDVKDNQEVKKGDEIFKVDDTRYLAAIAQLQAQLDSKRYSLELAKHVYERRQKLESQGQMVSEETLENARIKTKLARAALDLTEAQYNTAKIDLERSVIKAPVDGSIINLTLREGNYVSRGKSVLSIVKKGSLYVTGYFEETKLPLIHIGQKAQVTLMSGGQPLMGTVTSIGKAIADTNTTGNSQLLPVVQQTFNWVRLAQRIPVDIKLDDLPADVNISAGMTVSVYLQQNDK